MIWERTTRGDPFARDIADRHYSRQKVGSTGFVPPGSCVVFRCLTETGRAYWVTSFPFAEYVKHRWAGAWICSAFRNEGAGVASDMIAQAVAATRHHYGEPPPIGMITFVNRAKVRPTKVRGVDVYGWSFRKAGFEEDGETVGGLLTLRLRPDRMPTPEPGRGEQANLLAASHERR